jgi:hypothetical protein
MQETEYYNAHHSKEAGYFETSITMYQTAGSRIPQDGNLRSTVTICVDDGTTFFNDPTATRL